MCPELACIFNPYFALASCINAHMAVLLGSGCSQSFLGAVSNSMVSKGETKNKTKDNSLL